MKGFQEGDQILRVSSVYGLVSFVIASISKYGHHITIVPIMALIGAS